jgi:hypothetical protein
MRLDDLINDRLGGIVAHGCEVISDIDDMITAGVVGFSGTHRVVGAVGVNANDHERSERS